MDKKGGIDKNTQVECLHCPERYRYTTTKNNMMRHVSTKHKDIVVKGEGDKRLRALILGTDFKVKIEAENHENI